MKLPKGIFTKTGKINSNYIRKDEFLKSEDFKNILKNTHFLNGDVLISERIYCIKNDIKERLKCPICNSFLRFKTYTLGYSKSCPSEICKRKIYNWKSSSNTKKEKRRETIGNFLSLYRENKFKKVSVELFIKKRVEETNLGRLHTFINEAHYKNNIDELCNILSLTEKYLSTDDNIKWSERFYLIMNNFRIGKCEYCDKKTNYNSYVKGYNKTCSSCKFILGGKRRIKSHFEKHVLPNLKDQQIEIIGDYKGLNNSRIELKCQKCGNIINKDLSDGAHNNIVCYKCLKKENPMSSIEEDEVYKFIKENYDGEIISSYRLEKGQSSKSIDIFCPELNFGIEYNGIYFHSYNDKIDVVEKNKHLIKTKMCEKLGIFLFHIFSNEWQTKRSLWESMIKLKLGKYKNKIYARNCEIRELENIEKNDFLMKNHLQGGDLSSIKLGLFQGEELVSVMTFGKPRFNKKYEWELIRFCSKKEYIVVGAASKLLKYFERNYGPKSIISYADRSRSTGNLYKKIGFCDLGETTVSYFYYKRNEIVSRFQAQKHKLSVFLDEFDEKKTEEENMFANNYRKVFDCGNLVFEKRYDK